VALIDVIGTVLKAHLEIDLQSPPTIVRGAVRNVGSVGHLGNGDLEYSPTSAHHLDEIRSLIRRAYDQAPA